MSRPPSDCVLEFIDGIYRTGLISEGWCDSTSCGRVNLTIPLVQRMEKDDVVFSSSRTC